MPRPFVFCCIVAFVFAFAPLPAGAATHTIHGTVVVHGGVALADCAGADDQSDVHAGSRLRVEDGRHRVIASTRLGAGSGDGGGLERCRFHFTVRDVATSPSYTFLVADRSEGRTVTRARLAAHGWRVTLEPASRFR